MLHSQLRCARLLPVLLLAAVPSAGQAQEVATSLDQLRALVEAGDAVTVTDRQGRQTQGNIAEISPTSLALVAGGTRTVFAESDLDTVSRRDSRWNGTLWGLAAGGLLGALFDTDLVEYYGREDISVGESVAFVATAAGVGAGIGFAVDALIKGRRVLYSASRPSAGRNATVAPLWSGRRKGIVVSLLF